MVAALLGLCLVSLLGFLLITAVWGRARLSLGERAAVGFGVGLGSFTYVMFVALALGFPLSAASTFLLLVLLVVSAGLLAGYHRRATADGATPASTPSAPASSRGNFRSFGRVVSIICLGMVLCLWLSALVVTLYWPIWTWDALAMFDYRGRVISATQSLGFLKGEMYRGSYPLLTSLAHALVYTLGGGAPQIIYPLYYLALLVVFHANVRCISGQVRAGVLTAVLAGTPIVWKHATEAFANLTFTFYYAAGVMYVYRWVLTSQKRYLGLGGLLLGLSAWARYGSEALFLAVLLPVTAYGFLTKQRSAPFALVAAFASLDLPWLLYQKYVLGVSAAELYGVQSTLWDLSRWRLIFDYLAAFLVSTGTQGAIWPMFLCFVLLNARRWRERSTFLVAVVLLGLGGWAGSIYLTRLDAGALAKGSGERLLLTLIPVALFYCAVNPLMTRSAFHWDTVFGWRST